MFDDAARLSRTLLLCGAVFLFPLAGGPAAAQTGTSEGGGNGTEAASAGDAAGKEAQAAAEQAGEAEVEKQVEETVEAKRKKILEEAVAAVRDTRAAIEAIEKGEADNALAALERVTGKLAIILAREPDLALAPYRVEVLTFDVLAGPDDVVALREQAEEALEAGRLQLARRLIRDLASEIVVRVHNVPLATYPAAIQRAAALLDAGKADEAKQVLQRALSTLVATDTIVPLPFARIRGMLADVRELTAGGEEAGEKAGEQATAGAEDAKKERERRLAAFLVAMRAELAMADALGYGTPAGLAKLAGGLDELAKNLEAGKVEESLFEELERTLSELVVASQFT